MESEYETIVLEVRDYVSPESSCKIEDMVNAVPHVVDSAFDPVNNILKVRVHKGMATADDITKELKRCAVRSEQRTPTHEKAHLEHGAMGMKKPAAHDHHAIMEAEFRKHFLAAVIFTIPVLVLSPSVQAWVGYSLPTSPVWDALLLIMASVVILYGGLPFYRGVRKSIRMRTLDMNVLVAIALLSGYLY